MIKNTGGQAFPIIGIHEEIIEVGMTLRDYFAAKADLSKFEVNSASDAEFLVGRPMPDRSATGYQQVKWQADLVAAIRYMMADAMIAARERGEA